MKTKVLVAIIVLLLIVWAVNARVTLGVPTVTGKVGTTCRPGEVFRGGFCATPAYWAELDAG